MHAPERSRDLNAGTGAPLSAPLWPMIDACPAVAGISHTDIAPSEALTRPVDIHLDARRRILRCECDIEILLGYASFLLHGAPWQILFTERSQERLNLAFAELDALRHPHWILFEAPALLARHADGALCPISASLGSQYRDGPKGYRLQLAPAEACDRSPAPPRAGVSRPESDGGEAAQLLNRLNARLRQHRRLGRGCALILIDFVDIEQLSASLAREEHRQIAQTLCERLAACHRDQDELIRLAPLAFALMLDDISGEHSVKRVAQRLRTRLSEPLRVQQKTLQPQPRIGMAAYPDQGFEARDLLRQAEGNR